MILKKQLTIGLALLLLLTLSLKCMAASGDLNRREWGFGWQFSQPAGGLSVRCPIEKDYYLQPILLVNINDRNGTVDEEIAYGLRGIYNLPPQGDFRPYTGIGIGYNKKTNGTVGETARFRGGSGFEAFFGIEYIKYVVRPTIDIAIGGFNRIDGGYDAGITCNLSLMYYF